VTLFRSISFILILFLFACAPKKPELPLNEVPAGPLLQELEKRQHIFHGLKAMASIEIRKTGSQRTLENVGIIVDGQRRLRMEAYGPLGQSVMVLVWDGKDVFMRRPDQDRVERLGPEGISRLLGEGLDIRELCALLAGNIPETAQPYQAAQFCGQNNTTCVLEIRQDSRVRRVEVVYSGSGAETAPRLITQELYRSGKLIYRARFDQPEIIAHYQLPLKIRIENPADNLQLTIEYTSEIGINVPISDDVFSPLDGVSGR
jgi:hypothetical protein